MCSQDTASPNGLFCSLFFSTHKSEMDYWWHVCPLLQHPRQDTCRPNHDGDRPQTWRGQLFDKTNLHVLLQGSRNLVREFLFHTSIRTNTQICVNNTNSSISVPHACLLSIVILCCRYVTIDGVRVPRENVIGEEGKGFIYTMANFNTERWGMVGECDADFTPHFRCCGQTGVVQ